MINHVKILIGRISPDNTAAVIHQRVSKNGKKPIGQNAGDGAGAVPGFIFFTILGRPASVMVGTVLGVAFVKERRM